MSSKSSSKLQLRCVGWVKDAHSLRGDLYIQLFAKKADWLETLKTIYLEKDAGPVAFTVEKAKPFKDGLIVHVEGMPDRTAAEGWRKAKAHIDAALLVAEPGERVFLDQLLDFVVFDSGKPAGKVCGFSSNGAQDLLRVILPSGAEALVPLVDAFLERIDFERGEIYMNLPPGLLDEA